MARSLSLGRGAHGLLVAFLLLVARPAAAAELSHLDIAIDGRKVEASFTLAGAFDDEMVERIDSGLPTGFTYEFELLKDRKRWYDAKLDETTLQIVTMYNAVTREYLVNTKRDGKLVDSRVVHDIHELEAAMTRFDHVSLFALPAVPPSWRLLVRGRAELRAATLFSLIPVQVTTEWLESRKFQVPPVP